MERCPSCSRFPAFDLDDWDQLWLFGDLPNYEDGADGAMTDDDIRTFGLTDEELKIIAKWMDRGGGVFATGDHTLLGASLASRRPRVRTMRRWTLAQRVPARDSSRRHETLQPNPDADDIERDTLLQRVELVYRQIGDWPFGGAPTPHPLFRSVHGPIDRFPDHMHEGEVMPDDEVPLDQPLDIPGYDRPEYPHVEAVLGNAFSDAALPFARPRPHVVAFGRTTNTQFPGDVFSRTLLLSGRADPPIFAPTKRFGLVGVYDGDSVGIGRVVVDSTWHHWLSVNLHTLYDCGIAFGSI